ncbi:Holliday junction resolvase RuvX [Bacteroidetes bacterium endosymbiont of Geopemphigus sp.]|uniref:Holliday junction resolvase RuvX n=1 Tax=Bacteroidetes bacterium endosymbiont of Geopemphigus sp. TaxID=2047937 RepID=UPI000CD2880B|nr:Holliday junction resolvase RuvX [Bacteroidetes bacterium endosymbiont of Geopemphigus sp.]
MSRILAIDYGSKRTGLATTDPLELIASGLKTVATEELMVFLEYYLPREEIHAVVVGEPKLWNNEPSLIEKDIQKFIKKFRVRFPDIYLDRVDERFTSKVAQYAMIGGGLKKKARQNKALIDKISAVLILQSYLDKKKMYDFTNHYVWGPCIEKKM